MTLTKIKQYLKKNKFDAIILFNKDPNFNYFLDGEFEHGFMILTQNQNCLSLSPLYSNKFKKFKVINWKNFKKEFEAFIKKHKIKCVGINNNDLLVIQKNFLRKYFKTKDVGGFLRDIRQIKTKEEIGKIKKACKITDIIFSGIVAHLRGKKFKTERQIYNYIKIRALELGDGVSFDPIVASGSNATTAHYIPENKKLKKGFMVLDFGVKYKGYLSDMTRTVYLGKPSQKEIEIYEKMLKIQNKCIEKAVVGLKAEKLHSYCAKLMGTDAKYFNHGLGHGIGVVIHEAPSLTPKSKNVLQRGTVFTIEPGYYNKKIGVGIRIEDDVFLWDKKEVLTKSTKKLICIGL